MKNLTKTKIVMGLAALLLALSIGGAAAQSIRVTGNVRDDAGQALGGVMITEEGTQNIAITDMDGDYEINVANDNATLAFSFMGYTTVERLVGTQRVIDVVLLTDATQIDEVVVTALGIVRKEKSLTYATQVLDGDELTRVKDPAFLNSLAGKTAGVQVNRSSAGVGGSSKIVIRGNRSLNGVGGPLYVIDGVPIGGTGNGGTNTFDSFGPWDGGRDTGDAMSNLNPDDIESMSVLKGPSAAALYGTSAANGVILITTKKGRAGRADISFSSNTTFDKAVYGIPKFQNSYGGAATSWGDPISKTVSYTDDFFQTGVTTINALSLSTGTESAQTYFSYANTYAKGVVPGNELNKHNFNFRETAKFFNDRLTVDANITMMYQKMENLPSPGGYYMNAISGLYRFPRGGHVQGEPDKTFQYFKDNFEVFDDARNFNVQNWHAGGDHQEQNPFWIAHRTPSDSRRYRTLANLSLSLKVAENLTLQVRGKADYNNNYFEKKLYASTDPTIVSSGNGANGFYSTSQDYGLSIYGDVLLTYSNTWENWSLNATLGGSISDGHGRSQSISSVSTGLDFPNAFNVNNIIPPARPSAGKWRGAQDQAVFFAGQVGWKDQLFLDVTARNDWTSTLAYTPSMKKGFFYPSFGLSWLLNETLNMPEWVNLGKVRASWAQVGNGIPGGSSNPMWGIGFGPVMNSNRTEPNTKLKPEMTTSIEFGTEWRFFNSRLEFDFTWYKTNSRDQAFNIEIPTGESEEYTHRWINAGNIENKGFEITLGGTPVWTGDFSWRTALNFSTNKNTVIELDPADRDGDGKVDMEYLQVGSENVNNGYQMRIYPGGSFGDIYGYAFERDGYTTDREGNQVRTHEGNIEYDDNGLPITAPKNYLRKLGNASPDFNLGWQNTLSWKGINLYFLIDGRFGGEVISMTEADMDLWGTSKRTGDDRKKGSVEFDGRQITDVEAFYNRVGGRGGVTEHYVYDATNIRLRELSIGYSLPRKWLAGAGWIKGVDISLIGRNLFFFMNKAPYDPDAVMSTGLSMQGVDVYGMPSPRSFGFNVKLNF